LPTARDVLNDLKWNRGQLAGATIAYVHRGAPDDTAVIAGAAIVALRRSFFDLASGASIPYHRVLRIALAGAVVWERGREAGRAGEGAARPS
jgi:hypothetical protein